jgi:tetratricopeptide (TPR) repeat protein
VSDTPSDVPSNLPTGASPGGTAFPESLKLGKRYTRAVGPRLRKLLHVLFAILALLGANSCYLASITFMGWLRGETYENHFYEYMFLGHLALGLLLIVPFLVFGVLHMIASRHRRNRRAIRVGYALFGVAIGVLVTGLLLMRVGSLDLRQPMARSLVYWAHVALPLVAGWLYWLHRLVGSRIKWRLGLAYAAATAAAVLLMVAMHSQDPRQWYAVGPESGAKYFEPSLARTSSGQFVSAENMMNNDYCRDCHADVHAGWLNSAHHFSSFNNPAYLASVNETRKVAMERDGNVQASRWCAGCHDPVPFFTGAFDDPKFDMIKHPTSQAGITCTACHAITNVNSTRGNADYTIEEPLHYPFAFSENPLLRWVNHQLVKAKPAFHKKTFLKPFHKSAEFCSTCHKVSLPFALNNYKEFLRGQNHYDPYLLSGVSGHGARSFYYPPEAKTNCSQCHMPLKESDDFAAAYFDGAKQLSVHDHLFPAANTGLAWMRGDEETIKAHQQFLQGILRVDLFGVREGGEIDGPLVAPLRPQVPTLKPGGKYLFEAVVRTLKMGHFFTQGTVDSNEVWLEVTVTSGDRVIGRNGAMDPARGNEVDRYAHFMNVFMLDKDGNRINRRNPQDIFTPLYNHQIPPGAGQTAHYEMTLPEDLSAPVTVEVKLQYRKFDQEYMDYVGKETEKLGRPVRGHKPGESYVNELPVTTMAVDRVTFPVEGIAEKAENGKLEFPEWQRWNDYGIGLLLKGKAELRQAEEAFVAVEKLGRFDGPMNLARVYLAEGRLDDAVAALNRAEAYRDTEGFPRWTWAWLAGDVARQQGFLEEAEKSLRSVLEDRTPEMDRRRFDFSMDYEVLNLHGQVLFDLGRQLQRIENARREQPTATRPVMQSAEQSAGAETPHAGTPHTGTPHAGPPASYPPAVSAGEDAASIPTEASTSRDYFLQAIGQFRKTLQLDSENVTAHYNLQLLYAELGDKAKSDEHAALHQTYKPDDNAQGRAVRLAREKYPAANLAAEAVVKYPLQRPGAPGL